MADNNISVQIAFNGDYTTVTSYTDLDDYLLQLERCEWGRQGSAQPWNGGEAHFTLQDLDRRFDPLNTSSPYYADGITPGKIVRLRFYKDSARTTVYRTWMGHIHSWEPHYPTDGNLGYVRVVAVDYLRGLGLQGFEHTPIDHLLDRINRSSSGFFINGRDEHIGGVTGILEDQGPLGIDGQAWEGTSPPYTKGADFISMPMISDDVLWINNNDNITIPVEDNTLNKYRGFFACIDFLRRNTDDVTAGVSATEEWWLMSEGSGSHGWNLYMREDRSAHGNNYHNDNPVTLHFEIVYNSGGVVYLVTKSWGVGTRADWHGQRRVVAVALDGSFLNLAYAVPPEELTLVNGNVYEIKEYVTAIDYSDLPFKDPSTSTDPWSFRVADRVGAGGPGFFHGDIVGIGFVAMPTSVDWLTDFMSMINVHGLEQLQDMGDEIDRVIGGLEFPSGSFTYTPAVLPATPFKRYPFTKVSSESPVTYIQQLALMERGGLWQNFSGVTELQGSIQGGLSPSVIDYGVGTAPMQRGTLVERSDPDAVINAIEVTIPGNDSIFKEASSTSNMERRVKKFSLPFHNVDEAETWVDYVLAEYKTAKNECSFVIMPDSFAVGWSRVADQEMGCEVRLWTQHLDTGPLITTTYTLEGENWSWNAKERVFRVEVFCGPHRSGNYI